MRRIATYIAGDPFPAANENQQQDETEGARYANKNNDLTAMVPGTDGVRWQIVAAWSTAKIRQIDNTIDWRDRVVSCTYQNLTNDIYRIGQAEDYHDWTSLAPQRSIGYLGTGAYSNIATGAAVADAAPPVQGANPTRRSYYVDIGGATPNIVKLYCDPTDGSLWAYNDTGGGITPYIEVRASGDTGKR